ncbi:MAG TPA: zinc ribbon domain-containing protein [Solirubrobacteraceae bacterium]|nr:zinc ribbon domain-containing protein [Solirubrobacteraceae bacterium]
MSESKYCSNCGVAITDPSSFCSSCGARVAGELAQQPATPAPGNVPHQGSMAHVPSVHGEPRPAASPPPASATPASGPPASPPPGGAPPDASSPSDKAPLRSRSWVPSAAIATSALLVTALVVILLLALGGSAGKNVKSASVTRTQALQLLAANGTTTVSRAAPGLYAVVKAGHLNVIVPAGWRATAQTASSATRAEFADPKQSSSTLTIVSEKGAGGNDHRRALAARKSIVRKGYAESAFGRVVFPGGREAWRLTYANAGTTHSTYFYSACHGEQGMVVDASAASPAFEHEQTTLAAAAASAEPLC